MSANQIRDFWKKLDQEAMIQQEKKGTEKKPPKTKEPPKPKADPDKEKYEDRWGKLGPRMAGLDDVIKKKWPPTVDEDLLEDLKTAGETYEEAKAEVVKAESKGDYKKANEALDDFEETFSEVDDAAVAVALDAKPELEREEYFQQRQRYLAKYQPIEARVSQMTLWINTKKLDDFQGKEKDDFEKANSRRFTSTTIKRPPDYAAAYVELDPIETAMTAIEKALGTDRLDELKGGDAPTTTGAQAKPDEDEYANLKKKDELKKAKAALKERRQRLEKLVKQIEKGIKTNQFGELDTEAKDFAKAKDAPMKAAQEAEKKSELKAEKTALDLLQQVIDTFEKAVQLAAGKAIGDLQTKKASTDEIREEASRWAKLDPTALRQVDPGLLDQLVDDVGKKAKESEDKALVRGALVARFDLEFLEGKLSTKAMPRLYDVMKLVPESHIRNNPRLKQIKRDRPLMNEKSSYYQGSQNLIYLSLIRTGEGFDKIPLFGGASKEKFDPDDAVPDKDKPDTSKHSRFDAVTLHEIGHAVDENVGFMKSKGKSSDHGGWRVVGVPDVAEAVGSSQGFYDDFKTYPGPWLRAYLGHVLQANDPEKKLPAQDSFVDVGSNLATREELVGDPGILQAETDRRKLEEAGWDSTLAGQAIEDCRKKCKLKNMKQVVGWEVIDSLLSSDDDERLPLAEAVDAALAQVTYNAPVTPPAKPGWKDLAKHAAVEFCKKIRLKGGSSGLWDEGASGAGKYAIKGRVYQEAYKGSWVSYELAARSKGISQYQFRADGEWFAEVYSAFFLEKLPTSHPLYEWLKDQKAKG